MAENPTSRKYDVAKRITIRSAFLAKAAGYSSFNEIQKTVGFPEVNILFKESSQARSI